MELSIVGRSKERKDIIEKVAKFYLTQLNLDSFTHTVIISLKPQLCKETNSNGYFIKICDGLYQIILDSRLEITQCLRTLAHELVHLKQSVRGQYQTKINKNGKPARYWLGKKVNKPYHKQPWELEAFRREEELLDTLFAHIAQKKKKQKR